MRYAITGLGLFRSTLWMAPPPWSQPAPGDEPQGSDREGGGVQTWEKPRLGWTAVLRRQPTRSVAGQPDDDDYPAFEVICRDCGDDPSLDYREVSPMLQRLRGPYWLAPGMDAYERHLQRHGTRPPGDPAGTRAGAS